jgi:hypothetical protein
MSNLNLGMEAVRIGCLMQPNFFLPSIPYLVEISLVWQGSNSTRQQLFFHKNSVQPSRSAGAGAF